MVVRLDRCTALEHAWRPSANDLVKRSWNADVDTSPGDVHRMEEARSALLDTMSTSSGTVLLRDRIPGRCIVHDCMVFGRHGSCFTEPIVRGRNVRAAAMIHLVDFQILRTTLETA